MTIILRQCAVAVAVMLSGVVYGQTAIDATAVNNYKRYHGDGIDNVLQYVPTVAVFGLKMCGVKTETSWKKRLTVSVASFAVNAGVTYVLKRSIHEKRPDGTDNRSFPSGHTSIAFCGATSLMHEYYKVSPWIGVAGYAVATTVAVDRVRPNDVADHGTEAGLSVLLSIQFSEQFCHVCLAVVERTCQDRDYQRSVLHAAP